MPPTPILASSLWFYLWRTFSFFLQIEGNLAHFDDLRLFSSLLESPHLAQDLALHLPRNVTAPASWNYRLTKERRARTARLHAPEEVRHVDV